MSWLDELHENDPQAYKDMQDAGRIPGPVNAAMYHRDDGARHIAAQVVAGMDAAGAALDAAAARLNAETARRTQLRELGDAARLASRGVGAAVVGKVSYKEWNVALTAETVAWVALEKAQDAMAARLK